jgi:gas vesicle protein
MAENHTSMGTVVAAFAVGAIAGAVVALLFAPASGEETRRKLAEKAREGRKRVDELAREGREFLERQGDQVVSAIDRGREAFERAQKERL